MKIEREPVFGQLSLSHKPDYKPYDHNEIMVDSAGLESKNWIVRESQNKITCDSKVNEEHGQDNGTGLAALRYSSKSVDDLITCNEGVAEASPFTLSSERYESLGKQSDYYMDKSVMEYDLPELIVCYKESSCNTIKDICIDEGVPSKEKIWFKTDVDEKAFCTYLSPNEDQTKKLLDEQMDIGMTIPNDITSSAEKCDIKKDYVIPGDAKDMVQREEAIYGASEKTAVDVSGDMFPPDNELSTNNSGTENLLSGPSNKSSNEAVLETVQISSEKESETTQIENSLLVSATEEFNTIEKEAVAKLDPVLSAVESNYCIHELSGSSKVDNGSITSGLDRSAPVSISRFAYLDPVSSTDVSDCPIDELRDKCEAETGGSGTFGLNSSEPLAVTTDVRSQNPFSEHLETQHMSEDDSDVICDSTIVSPVTIAAREECPENGTCQCPESSNISMVDENIPVSKIVSSQVQHSLEPPVIARKQSPQDVDSPQEVLIQVQRDLGESSFSAGVPFSSFLNYSEPMPSSDTQIAPIQIQRDLGESSFSASGHSSSLIYNSGPIPPYDSHNAAIQVHRDLGESSFTAAGQLSSLIDSSGPIPYSGSVSLRSDSSATSTRSFAFPVFSHSEPFSSPTRMAKANRRQRGWKRGLFCCNF